MLLDAVSGFGEFCSGSYGPASSARQDHARAPKAKHKSALTVLELLTTGIIIALGMVSALEVRNSI